MSVSQARRALMTACALGLASVLIAAPAQAVGPVFAEASAEIIQGQYVRLVSVADWDAATGMRPGEHVQWDIAVSANAPEPGTVMLGISATGGAQLVADVSLCLQAWTPSGCPGGAQVLQSQWSIPRDGREVALADFGSDEVAHLRLFIALAPAGEQGATELRVHAHGEGEAVVVGPDGGLATTGMSQMMPWILGGGVGLLVLGLLLVLLRRRPSSQDREGAP